MTTEDRNPADMLGEPIEEEHGPSILLAIPQQNAWPYLPGVMAFGALTLSFMVVAAVVLGSPGAVLALALSAAFAYGNYTFLHAIQQGYFPALGFVWLARLSLYTALASVVIVLLVAAHLAALAG